MSNIRMITSTFLLCCLTGGVFAKDPPRAQQRLETKAHEAAERAATQTLTPHEINMIEYRRTLMGKPGLQLYVIFLNDVGQPVEYFVTNGKCTSSNKRLTRSWRFERGQTGVDKDGNRVIGDFVMNAPDLDGTHGSSDDYVFCKTADGKYKQWNGKYYISDAPIELTIKPVIIDKTVRNQQQQ